MSLELSEHLESKPAFKEGDDVFEGKDHLLVELDCDFETQREDYAQEGRLHVGVAAQVGVGNVYGVCDGLVEALSLDCELKHRETGFLAHLGVYAVLVDEC